MTDHPGAGSHPDGRSTDLPDTLARLISSLADAQHRPALVSYQPGGARTELSGASLANWTAKVSGLLRDELGLGPGDLAAVLPTSGWQLAPVLLGCWWAGICVTGSDDPAAAVAFVAQGADAEAGEVLVLSGHPLGAPATGIAEHQRDFTTAVLPQPDRLGAPAAPGGQWQAVRGGEGAVTEQELLASVTAAARGLLAAVPEGRRPVLISTLEWTLPGGISRTLLAALAAGGHLVQCPPDEPGAELASIARIERATSSIGAEIPGLATHPALSG